MQAEIDRKARKRRVRYRIRRKVSGSATRPRIAVYRSLKHIYVQAIDDGAGRTLAHASSQDAGVRAQTPKTWNIDSAKLVGQAIADRLKQAGIGSVVFDRGGLVYHGRIKALADAMRSAGLAF